MKLNEKAQLNQVQQKCLLKTEVLLWILTSFKYNTGILDQQNELKYLTNFSCSDFCIPGCLILFPRSSQLRVPPTGAAFLCVARMSSGGTGPSQGLLKKVAGRSLNRHEGAFFFRVCCSVQINVTSENIGLCWSLCAEQSYFVGVACNIPCVKRQEPQNCSLVTCTSLVANESLCFVALQKSKYWLLLFCFCRQSNIKRRIGRCL